MRDEPVDRAHEVAFMDPGHELPAVACATTKTKRRETPQDAESAAGIRSHDHGHPHRDLARPARGGLGQRGLPRARDVDAEPPRARCVWFGSADDTGELIVRRVVAVRVQRGSARLEPYAWRPRRTGDRCGDGARRAHARVDDLAAVALVVPAVDAAACEIDHRIRALDLVCPRSE